MLAATTASITHDDPVQAGRDLAAELNDGLGGQPDLVLLFAAPAYTPHALLDGLYRRLDPRVPLIGCTSFAEIGATEALAGSVTALGLRSDTLGIHTLCAPRSHGDSFAIGQSLGRQARARGSALLVLLVDAIHLDSDAVLTGVQSVLGPRFPIVGGIAADDARFARTHQFHGRDVHEGAAVALALSGPLRLATAACGGWEAVGATRRCTRAGGDRLLLELDGQPALNLYRDYLGAHGRDFKTAGIEFPLAIVEDDEVQVVCVVHGVDPARGGLRCNRAIPEGAEVRMLRATKNDLIRGAADAASDLQQRLPGAQLTLVFDCFARKLVLGARYKEEVTAAYAHWPADRARVGFYTYGELAPVRGRTTRHDATFTAVAIEA